MFSLPRSMCFAMLAILSWLAPAAFAQEKIDKVRIKTVDGVTLHGKFYAGKGSESATVLLLHALGEDSKRQGWTKLAESLQLKGYAVLTFDFRGHGTSTEVDPQLFWSNQHPFNRLARGGPDKSTIEYKGFSPQYYTALVNDIAAAKAFLDRKNDAGICNTSSMIVIGGETGATLGAIWLNSEWHRYRLQKDQFGRLMPDKRAEGNDTIAAIWLSISPALGKRGTISLAPLLKKPALLHATPMNFVHGALDSSGKKLARSLEQNLVVAKKGAAGKPMRDEKYKFTGAMPIPDTKLKGSGLLEPRTNDAILAYIEEVLQHKSNERVERDFRRNTYIWSTPTMPRLLAKNPGDMNMIFSTYELFIPR